MKHRIIYPLLAFCVATTFLVSGLSAQDVQNSRLGTAAASELLIPVGARDVAIGGAGISTSSGIGAVHWNPAGLARMGVSAEGLFSTMSYIADINVNYGAVGLNFSGFGTLGISIKALDMGEIPITSVDDPEGIAGRTFSPTFVVLGLTYARQFTDAITAGGNIKLISEKMHRVTGKGLALDFGVQYHGVAGLNGLNLGVALKNIGPQVSFDGSGLLRQAVATQGNRPAQFYQSKAASWELPSSVELGLSYGQNATEEFSYSVHGSFSNENLALDTYRFGGEVLYGMGQLTLAGRAGTELLDKGADDEQIFGPSFGFGIMFDAPSIDITVDYAYRSVDFFQNNNMFSIILGF